MRNISTLSMRKASVAALFLYVLVYYMALGILSVQQVPLSQAVSDLLTLIGDGAGILIIVLGLLRQQSDETAVWRLFLSGLCMNFVGDFVWSYHEIFLQRQVPLPSLSDIFYVCCSICFLSALILYVRHEKLFTILRMGFNIVITMSVSATILFKYVMLPIWNDYTLTLLQRVVSLAYPLFDLCYLGGFFSLSFFCSPRTKWNRPNLLISAAFWIWFFADLLYGAWSDSNYAFVGILDPLWPVGCWLLALASLYPQRGDAEHGNTLLNRSSIRMEALGGYICSLIPYVSTSILVILVSYQYFFRDPLVAGTAITVLLIMGRQIFSSLENKRLLRIIQASNSLLEENKAELEAQNSRLQALNNIKEYEANTDYLTGMFNRRYISEALQTLQRESARSGKMEVSILLIDIDHYKQINDRWGHEVGDTVLQQIAFLIKDSIRAKDIAGRFGGDEFIILLPGADLPSAKSIADRIIRKTFQKQFVGDDVILSVSLSIGCVRWAGPLQDFDMNAVIASADKALYEAKEAGRNQYRAW